MTTFSLPFNKQVSVTAQFEDAAGNLSPVSGVTVVSSDITVLTVSAPSAVDSVSAVTFVATPVGPLGNATVTVSGTNTAGTVITGTQDFTIGADVATQVKITVGEPTAIVAAS
jgi:hypothetical protein